MQISGAQIPKAQKTVKLLVFFTLFGSTRAKAGSRMLIKLTPSCQTNLQHAFWTFT